MKIALAQIVSKKGDIRKNIAQHKRFAQIAAKRKANLLIFPELSITGYEPTLAKDLAVEKNDPRFDDFQTLSNQYKIIIGVGVPIQQKVGISISMLLFHPTQPRQVYTKKYLHSDEKPFFVSGANDSVLIKNTKIALAICYELSIKSHEKTAIGNGATLYLASVAKTEQGVKNAHQRLAGIAKAHRIPVLLVNSVGINDDFISAGTSAVWNTEGEVLKKTGKTEEGILFFDTKTQETKVLRTTKK